MSTKPDWYEQMRDYLMGRVQERTVPHGNMRMLPARTGLVVELDEWPWQVEDFRGLPYLIERPEEVAPMRYEIHTKNLHVPSIAAQCTVDTPLIKMVIRTDTTPPRVIREAFVHGSLVYKAAELDMNLDAHDFVLGYEFVPNVPDVVRVTLKTNRTYAELVTWAKRVKYAKNPKPLVHVTVEEVEF